jgi:preprotein translocase subunit SecE
VSLLAKKAGAANRRNVKARAKKVSKEEKMKKDERTAEPETASASEGKLRSFLRLIKNDKSKSDVQVPVKGKANKKATDKKEKRSVRTAAGKEKPKKSFFQNITRFFQSVWGDLKKVQWPGRNQLIAYSAVVVVAVIIVAFLIWIADILISWVVQLLLSL